MKNLDPLRNEVDLLSQNGLWNPLTPEEAEEEFKAAPDEPLSLDEIDALVRWTTSSQTQPSLTELKDRIESHCHQTNTEERMSGQLDLFGNPVQHLPTFEELVVQTFIETRDGWSSEYVVCNPDVNRRFLNRIRELAPSLTEADANRILWNARRAGKLTDLPKSKRYSPDKALLPFEFACEWAYRHLINDLVRQGHRRKNTTLERILCVPEWRSRFDELVTKIKSGFSPLDYRWVSLTLRKRSRKKHRAEASLFDDSLLASEATKKLPDLPGVYLIRSTTDKDLYTGWAQNLREQADRHFEIGQGSIIPDWLLPNEAPAISIAFHPFEKKTKNHELHETWRANLVRRNPPLNLFGGLGM